MTFITWWNTPNKPKTFQRSDIEKANELNRKRRELQEQFDNARRKELNKYKKYVK